MLERTERVLKVMTDPIGKPIRKAWVFFVDVVTRGINKLFK